MIQEEPASGCDGDHPEPQPHQHGHGVTAGSDARLIHDRARADQSSNIGENLFGGGRAFLANAHLQSLVLSGRMFDHVARGCRETELGGLPGARPSAPVIRLDQPALALGGGPPSPAPLWDGAARQVLVQFLDGTWRLCRLAGWRRRDAGTWLCDLRWGVSGRVIQAAYVFDQAMVQPLDRHGGPAVSFARSEE